MILESDPVVISQQSDKVFAYINNPSNLGTLMPDQVINWKATADSCSFTIQGMTDLELQVKERKPNSYFSLVPSGKSPFPFTLAARIREKDQGSEVIFLIDADLNPMLAMMAKRPLLNLVQIMAKKLSETTF
jgi:carbon monoxide dehydrogenase subunit G